MKNRRQEALLHVVQTRDVGSQEELQTILRGRGFDVNVATISRDIRELGIVKASSRDGARPKFRYVLQGSNGGPTRGLAGVVDFIESIQTPAHFLVIKTRPRSALLVGSELDKARWPELLGTIAGDDTLFAICSSTQAAKAAAKRLAQLRGNSAG